MAADKKHDYHLVDPSPWPIFCSFATLILAVGAVYYFKTKISPGTQFFHRYAN